MSTFANLDTSAINTAGPLAFEASGLVETLKTGMTSTSADTSNEALDAVKTLCEGVHQWIEPYLVSLLPSILDNLAAPKTAESARSAGNAILHKSNSHSVRIITSVLYESFTSMKWQTKKGALVLIGALASHHPVVVQRNLPEIILKLIEISSDVKKDVKEQCRLCFAEVCATITNVDIIPIVSAVTAAYMDPVKCTEKALDALIATTFINDVDLPTLGLLVPVLTKGMRERKVAIKRRAALVIGNMCKLVNDPRTAAQFYPILKPVLERGIEEIAVEEVRKVCQHSLETLLRVSSEAQVLSDAVFTQQQLVDSINKAICAKGGVAKGDVAKYSLLVDFMSKGTHFLVLGDNRAEEEWLQCLLPYLEAVVPAEEDRNSVAQDIIAEGTAALSAEKVDPEDEEEDLCNAQFSLAYGTRVLLHQTPFKVKIGRKYGLVGPNGAGKYQT